MASRTKPNVDVVWADTGAKSDPGAAKIATGWIAEIPTHQQENFMANRRDQFNGHINDYGIPTWDSSSEYDLRSVTRSTVDDQHYISKVTANTNNEPSASPAQWQLLKEYMQEITGTANNVIILDANGLPVDSGISLSLLQSSLTPQGNWDANTNSPTLPGSAATGDFWIVSVSGSTSLGGITDWVVGDWAVKTATGWAKVDNTEALTSDELAAIQGANSPSGSNVFLTAADAGLSSGDLMTLIQGSVENESDTSPGYVDSTDVCEDNVSHNGTIYYSVNGAVGATSSNWSSVLPISRPADVKRTVIRMKSRATGSTIGTDEDHADGTIVIDWANARVNGYMCYCGGVGYAVQACYRFTGSIGAGDNDFPGTLQNGSYASAGSAPTFRVNGTSNQISRLPMIGTCRNVDFEITHQY